jgi:hypothetical protein
MKVTMVLSQWYLLKLLRNLSFACLDTICSKVDISQGKLNSYLHTIFLHMVSTSAWRDLACANWCLSPFFVAKLTNFDIFCCFEYIARLTMSRIVNLPSFFDFSWYSSYIVCQAHFGTLVDHCIWGSRSFQSQCF